MQEMVPWKQYSQSLTNIAILYRSWEQCPLQSPLNCSYPRPWGYIAILGMSLALAKRLFYYMQGLLYIYLQNSFTATNLVYALGIL
jgi:hypothetical protein